MWVSPDGVLCKIILQPGQWVKKPTDEWECDVCITDSTLVDLNGSKRITIGDSDSLLSYYIDIGVRTMNESELARFTLNEKDSFTVKLLGITDNGYVHQWDAKKKFNIASRYRETGAELYRIGNIKQGAHKFARGLKILLSIPIDSVSPPESVDDVSLKDIHSLTAILYNNLASFYMKREAWLQVIDACQNVFKYDPENVKSRYKIAVAYSKDRDFEKAKKELEQFLGYEPENKVALGLMKNINEEIRRADDKCKILIKNMFK